MSKNFECMNPYKKWMNKEDKYKNHIYCPIKSNTAPHFVVLATNERLGILINKYYLLQKKQPIHMVDYLEYLESIGIDFSVIYDVYEGDSIDFYTIIPA